MKTFKAYIYSGIKEGLRTYRFLILFLGVFFFALMDPVMMKLLPEIMESQMQADMSALFSFDRNAAVESFISDIFEISTLVTALVLMGLAASEYGKKTLIIPRCSGASITGIAAAKITVYAVFFLPVSFVSVCTASFYASLLFGGEGPGALLLAGASLNIWIYFIFLVSLTFFISSLFRKRLPAGLTVLAVSYLLPAAASLFRFPEYVPSYLLTGIKLSGTDWNIFVPAAIISISLAVLFYAAAVLRMRKKEI